MTYLWTRIVSWHLVPRGSWGTLCGRESRSREQLDSLPANAKSCERCLLIEDKRARKGA